jgi:ABC-type nickel/cobalt efflux system permease component RcnA
MRSVLFLGFLLGMRHALEADHLAAVASLAAGGAGRRRATIVRGAVWGMGHTLSLLIFGGVCLWLDFTVPENLSRALEGGVGIMLLALGADVLWRMRKKRVHVHVHSHGDGHAHLHAHSHAPGEVHDPRRHEHPHPAAFPGRALVVGMVHGLAGSAALVLLAVEAIGSPWLGLIYILLFGVGSIAGMAVLSAVIAVPLEVSARRLNRMYASFDLVVGVSTIGIGLWVVGGSLLG